MNQDTCRAYLALYYPDLNLGAEALQIEKTGSIWAVHQGGKLLAMFGQGAFEAFLTSRAQPTPRPDRRSDPVLELASRTLAPLVLAWHKQQSDAEDIDDVEETQTIERDLLSALFYDTSGFDGFALAEALKGPYEPDARLVEILDTASAHVRAAHHKVLGDWLPTAEITAPALSSRVSSAKHPEYQVGVVIHVDTVTGEATVCFPDLGHVPTCSSASGVRGLILPWEDLVPAS